jgi:myo-inositol-1(or 4)-monophosphatase
VDVVAQRMVHLLSELSEKDIVSKTCAADLVSVADREGELALRESLVALLPGSGFVGEEFADAKPEGGNYVWVVDPVDGTSNYLCGLPIWCVSVGLCDQDWRSHLGVISAPQLGKLWTGYRGGGAFCNGSPCRVRLSPPGGGIHNSMLATGFPYDVSLTDYNNLTYFTRMQSRFQKIRRLGSAAIDLAYIAEGTFDGMWELKLKPWDCAAGVLLVEEAGGILSRIDGEPYRLGDPEMTAAATPELMREMLSVLNS